MFNLYVYFNPKFISISTYYFNETKRTFVRLQSITMSYIIYILNLYVYCLPVANTQRIDTDYTPFWSAIRIKGFFSIHVKTGVCLHSKGL